MLHSEVLMSQYVLMYELIDPGQDRRNLTINFPKQQANKPIKYLHKLA